MAGTPSDQLQRDNDNYRDKMTPRADDGWIIVIAKLCLTYWVWSLLYRLTVWLILKLTGTLHKSTGRPRLCVRHAADAYMMLAGGAVIGCYVRLLYLSCDTCGSAVQVLLFCALPVYRFFEAFSVIAMLHANGPYETDAPMRAVSKLLWSYLEFIVIFAAVYLGVAALAGDEFGSTCDPGFTDSWVNPLYFSMITIATVGYGDFAPQTACGRAIVVIEVISGLLLLVVILQRVLTISGTSAAEKAENQRAKERIGKINSN